MNDERKLDDADNGLTDSVRAALKNRYGPIPAVPPEIDHAILADARRYFEAHGPATLRPVKRRRISVWQWTAIGSTVAVACVLFLAIRPPQPERLFFVDSAKLTDDSDSDVDLNGRVDILDAFAMAREMRDGRSGFRDINHDGLFDQLDIDMVAREAVKL